MALGASLAPLRPNPTLDPRGPRNALREAPTSSQGILVALASRLSRFPMAPYGGLEALPYGALRRTRSPSLWRPTEDSKPFPMVTDGGLEALPYGDRW
jgi:hypothetical protein